MDEKGKDDGEFEASAFEALERDFQEILQELVGDKSLEHFRHEYEKLHRALKKSHDSEKHLIKKCRDLNTEIVQNAMKVQTALKLSQEDQATITALKKEIERAWKMVETSHEKEQRAKESIQNLKSEITKLGRKVEQGAGLSINQENTVNQLVQEKNDLIKHRDMLQGQVVQLQQQNSDLNTKVAKLDAERAAGSSELASLKGDLEALNDEAEKQQKRKDKLDKDLKDLRQSMEARQNDINSKKEEFREGAEVIGRLEKQLQDEQAEEERLGDDKKKLQTAQDKLKKELEDGRTQHAKLKQENADVNKQVQQRKDDIASLVKSKDKLSKQMDALTKKKQQGDADTMRLQESRDSLKSEISELTKILDDLQKASESDSKMITDILHERDMLTKNVIKGEERSKAQVELVMRHKGQANTLAKELQRWKAELGTQKQRMHELDNQRNKYDQDLRVAQGRYVDACEELKKREDQMAQLKKAIADVKAKLGQQKNLYEAVRTDKNLYEKNLAESVQEIQEMKNRMTVMYHNIAQLKEEIKEKDKAISQKQKTLGQKAMETEKTKENLERHKKQQNKAQGAVEQNHQDIKKLGAAIREAEVERQNQKKEFEAVTSERNMLGKELIKRNEELALLGEKIKIQESTLGKGETQYKNRQDEIRRQRDAIAALKVELLEAQQEAENIDDLKKEVYHLQRELLQERTKVKALSEELENPMNVHRWRKLEGSDPHMYELIQKVRTLQKRLISKTEEVVAKDMEIQKKDYLHKDLTSALEKQPGPEVEEQLEVYRETYGAKMVQMRSMQAELKTYQAQVSVYRDEIERLTRELQEVKKKYFDQKKKETAAQDTQRGDTRVIHPRPVAAVRFTGGGFNLAH